MLNHTKQIKEMYEEIQRKLLYLIPEKWESIYLYSSVIEDAPKEHTGELFFYYIPKGIFRKNPVNVYEVPSKFNIDEKQYLDLVEKLYDNIKLLREEFKKTTQGEMWSNLTISITNVKFRAEYSYEDLVNNAFNSYERHVIWRYKYLDIGPEQVSKKDRDILYRYFNGARNLAEVEEYSAGIYIEQDTKNIFEYSTQADELENDGYIREDEIPDTPIEKKYNQIPSHKIENNWDANARKKEDTMWSQGHTSSEQYIIKSSRNMKRHEANQDKEITEKPKEKNNHATVNNTQLNSTDKMKKNGNKVTLVDTSLKETSKTRQDGNKVTLLQEQSKQLKQKKQSGNEVTLKKEQAKSPEKIQQNGNKVTLIDSSLKVTNKTKNDGNKVTFIKEQTKSLDKTRQNGNKVTLIDTSLKVTNKAKNDGNKVTLIDSPSKTRKQAQKNGNTVTLIDEQFNIVNNTEKNIQKRKQTEVKSSQKKNLQTKKMTTSMQIEDSILPRNEFTNEQIKKLAKNQILFSENKINEE